MNKNRPLILIVLDGWGYRETLKYNAIATANKPNWDNFLKSYPHTYLQGSGCSVGLPAGQMGNSEVGHMNIGAGRIVHQELTRIDLAIEEASFFTNPTLLDALHSAKKTNKAVHVMGLLSPGGVHSHENHLFALLKLAAKENIQSLFIHAFLDGRDTPPQSAMISIKKLAALCKHLQCGRISSLIGRYYAMDRDKRFDRIQKAYELLVQGKTSYQAETATLGLELAYARGETDEFVSPTLIHSDLNPITSINDGDIVIFMNFRADRARELSMAFQEPEFQGFHREKWPQLARFVTLTQYDKNLSASVAYQPQSLNNIFAACISKAKLKQLRIAETEKYAHVTFFFNGGIEQPFPGEDRILIPSLKVATYDLQPAMSAIPLTDKLINKITEQAYDVIICNFANADMVGHTGNFSATVEAIETIDQCLGRIAAAVAKTSGELLITADHGNAEQMFDEQTNQLHTAHTSDPVPFIFIGRPAVIVKQDGKLSDIAPTMLYLLNISQPKEMTGQTLINVSIS